MVPATIRRGSLLEGLHPLRIGRDLRQVIDLIEIAFGDALDVDAQRALSSMRLPAWLAPVVGVFDSLSLPGEGMMPGFVWLDCGKVVGAASVRRIHPYKNGWLVSNVAVHPEWQGQGIGRVLLEAALDYARDYGGAWVVLQVRDDNLIARRLYESLGFTEIAEVTRFCKKRRGDNIDAPSPDVPGLDALPTGASYPEGLQPARWTDSRALSSLARSQVPHDVLWPDALNHELYHTGPWHHAANQLHRRRRQWWVLRDQGAGLQRLATGASRARPGIFAAIGIEVDTRTPWHRLRLIVAPEARDGDLAAGLIRFGLHQLEDVPPLPVEIEHPAADETTRSALMDLGFERTYALVHMRSKI